MGDRHRFGWDTGKDASGGAGRCSRRQGLGCLRIRHRRGKREQQRRSSMCQFRHDSLSLWILSPGFFKDGDHPQHQRAACNIRSKTSLGRLTDDDLDVINGRQDQLEGKIQERYGLAKDQAKKDVDTWFKSLP
jgi:uncharacterized protein YjbJ (UPF0337 family)